MATLQKIRNRGKILIFTVGLALFAFIAEEFVRSLSYTQTERHQRVGKSMARKSTYRNSMLRSRSTPTS